MVGGVETWLKGNISGLLGSTQFMAPVPISYDWARPWLLTILLAIGDVVKAAGMSFGGVHGIVGSYISPGMPESMVVAAVLSTPMKVSPEDTDWFLLRAPSMLVGGVAQPCSSL